MSTESVTTYSHGLPDGRVLSCAVLGLPLISHGPPDHVIIYHHGWPSCRFEALALNDFALNRNYRIFAVDRPGIGKSTFNPKGSYESWAKDIQHFMDSQDIKTAVFMGVSGGGPFACTCARYLPQRCSALVTISSMVATNGPANRNLLQQMHWLNRLHSHIIANPAALRLTNLLLTWPMLLLAPYTLTLIGKLPSAVRNPLCQLFTSVGYAEADRQLLLENPQLTWDLLPKVMQQSVLQGISGLEADMAITSNPYSFDLKDIKVPVVLVFQGEDDVTVHKGFAQHIAAKIPGAKLKCYAGEGHLSTVINRADDILSTLATALKG